MNTINDVKVADEVWIATALLHLEHPEKTDFTVKASVERAGLENLCPRRPGVQVHASLHCVANKPPNPGRLSMLYATGKSTRRLFSSRDDVHPLRKGKVTPDREEIPSKYRYLLDWYETKYRKNQNDRKPPYGKLLALSGLGKEIWKGMNPDAYVRGLREGWK